MISFNNVTLHFGKKVILNKCNYKFLPNTVYILKGKSGVGKTTILNLIMGYCSLTTGNIDIENTVNIEYLFQEELLFSNLSVFENLYIKYCSNYSDTVSLKNLRLFFIDILKNVFLEDLIDSQVKFLSGGERQRVQLAQMLISNPDIILMDEPTSKLDDENKNKVLELISKVFAKKLIIIVTHDELDINGKNITLDYGKIIDI